MLSKKFIAGGVILLVILGSYFEEQIELGWGYSVNWLGGMQYNITRHENLIVERSIFDYQRVDGYLIGIRLPTKEIKCGYKHMKVALDPSTYFVLDLDGTQVTEYFTKTEFERVVKLLPDYEGIRLKYEIIENIFKFGNRIDGNSEYIGCLKINDLLGRRVVRLVN